MRFVAQSLWIGMMLGVAAGTTHPVHAKDRNPAPARSDGSIVKDHLRRARRARAAGKWTEAQAAYTAAFEAIDSTSVTERESAEVAGELGLCELKLRKFRDAAEHLAWSLERRKALSPEQQKGFADASLDGDLSERRDGLNGGAAASGSRCWRAADRPSCADLLRLRDERNLSAGVGSAMLIAGGVIGVATAASFFTDFSFLGLTPAQGRIHASPVATGREIGVNIEGLW
ncbi:hypothetical protein [Sorangium sp. So ce1099]|uniref:hypothetical protein n=1 Tax=Sorangium sp. So ce1099 TaxID=3133331 RepID=UPI003F644909